MADLGLATLLLLPALGAVATALFPARGARLAGAAVAAMEACLVLGLYARDSAARFQVPWIPQMGLSFHLGMDGLNVLLALLAALLVCVALLATSERVARPREYTVWMLLLLMGLEGVFLAQNLGLFYVFWEVMLIPAWLLVGRWGTDRSGRVPMKFFLYTLAGSLAMLLGVVALAFAFGSVPNLDFEALAELPMAAAAGRATLVLFALGFLVKVPLLPLHGWLPETYEAAPAPVTAVVAGAMSKAGVYGLLKVGLTLFPAALRDAAPMLGALALVTLLYGAACALAGTRIRQILAWSSLSHMGMMMLGLASLQPSGLEGASLQMFNHGLTTGGLFLLAGYLEDRGLPGELSRAGGLAARMPAFAAVFLYVAMASLGLPGLCSFPAEVLILNGAYRVADLWALLGGLGVVLAGWYTLRLYQGVMHGPPGEPVGTPLDLQPAEALALVPLLVLMLWIGVSPEPWADMPGQALATLLGGTW